MASEAAAEPVQQAKLRENILQSFGERATVLAPHAWKAFGLTVGIAAADSREIFSKLKTEPLFDFNMLCDLTAVDWLDKREPRFDVVYQLLSTTQNMRLCVKIQVDEDEPTVPTVVDFWPGANFMEREVWDMFGVSFSGNDDMRRILMYDEFVGHPLRKDYPIRGKQPRVALRIPELRNDSADLVRDELVQLPTRSSVSKNG